MQPRIEVKRLLALLLVMSAAVAALALPAVATQPPGVPGAQKRAAKAPQTDETVTLRGVIEGATGEEAGYTLRASGRTYRLSFGPAWYWRDRDPLEAHVGRTVEVVGELESGTNELDVQRVAGQELRAPGRPPWAGGWKRVGKDHPGWSQVKADRWAAHEKRMKDKFGGCFPPGQCREPSAEDGE